MSVKSRVGINCPSLDDPIVGCPIKGSVGVGGRNSPSDVLMVQQLLNSLAPVEGGPELFLKEDCVVGPKTTAAITKYQQTVLNQSDGRIDVDGPTIKALTDYVTDSPTIPYGKLGAPEQAAQTSNTPNTPKIPKADQAAVTAQAVTLLQEMEPRINSLRWKLTRTTPAMMGLLNKHFAHKKETVKSADIGQVQKVLAGTHHYIARFNAFGKLPVANVILFDEADPSDILARTVRGGDKMSTKQIQIYVDKGKASKNPGQSIWVTSAYANDTDGEKKWTLLHEFAHFVGARDGYFGTIDDHGYAFESKFLKLGKFQRLHNAESLSLFFLECCIGTKEIAKLPRMSSVVSHFDAFPKVNDAGDIVTS